MTADNIIADGYICANGAGDRWRTYDPYECAWRWTEDRDDAMRYARRIDAERAHQEDEDVWFIQPYRPAQNEIRCADGTVYELTVEQLRRVLSVVLKSPGIYRAETDAEIMWLRSIIGDALVAFAETHPDDETRCRTMAAALHRVYETEHD